MWVRGKSSQQPSSVGGRTWSDCTEAMRRVSGAEEDEVYLLGADSDTGWAGCGQPRRLRSTWRRPPSDSDSESAGREVWVPVMQGRRALPASHYRFRDRGQAPAVLTAA